jgi:hypothetical protein
MNILYALGGNYAGLACHYTEYINTHTAHHAKAFIRRETRANAGEKTATGSWYNPAVMPWVHLYELEEALAWADVVHCLYGESPHTLHAEHLVGKKRWVWGWIGMVCSREHMVQMFPHGIPRDGSVRFTHDDHGHDQYEPFTSLMADGLEVTRIPWLVNTLHPRFTPLPFGEREPRVGMYVHIKKSANLPDGFEGAYTAGLPRRWSDKGASRVAEELAGLPFHRNEKDIPWLDMLQLRRKCELGIDEMISPCWNLAGIEFLALGVPCLNCVNDYTVQTMRDVLGAPSPWIRCDWKTLREKVVWYFGLPPAERERMCAEARAWVERYCNPAVIWQMYEELYGN